MLIFSKFTITLFTCLLSYSLPYQCNGMNANDDKMRFHTKAYENTCILPEIFDINKLKIKHNCNGQRTAVKVFI